jgi:hypothetical protein
MLTILSFLFFFKGTDSSTLHNNPPVLKDKIEVFTGINNYHFSSNSFNLNKNRRLLLQPRKAPYAGFYFQYKWLTVAFSTGVFQPKDQHNNNIKSFAVGLSHLDSSWGIASSYRHYKGLELIKGSNAQQVIFPNLTYSQLIVEGYRTLQKNFSLRRAFNYIDGDMYAAHSWLLFVHADAQQWNEIPELRHDSITVIQQTSHQKYILNLVPEGGYAANWLIGHRGFNAALLAHSGVGPSSFSGKDMKPVAGFAWAVGTTAQVGFNGRFWYSFLMLKDDYLNYFGNVSGLPDYNQNSIAFTVGKRF